MAGVGWPKGKKRGPRKPVEHIANSDVRHGDTIGDNTSEPVDHDTAVTVDSSGSVIIDAVAIANSGTGDGGSAANQQSKRGRRKGTKNKASVNASAIEALLYSIHNMGAHLLRIEELQMEETEAKALGSAIAKVAEQYDSIPGMSEKTVAWSNLAMVAGMAYGTRIVTYRMRKANEERDAARKQGVSL